MRQVSARPHRGLSLFMSILSVSVIEILTFLEFGRSVFFFGGWAILFSLLTIWELSSEIKRSVKTPVKPETPDLKIQQKPLIVVELDASGQPKPSDQPTPPKENQLHRLKRWILRLKTLDDCILVVFFGVFTATNLILCLLAGLLKWT